MTSSHQLTSETPIICGMWGTSNLTLSLVSAKTGDILETRNGRGISKLSRGAIEEELFNTCGNWFSDLGVTEVYLGGMVGSTLGWWDVPYIECPTALSDILAQTTSKTVRGVRIAISPGLKCRNFLNEFDVIRGEEIELLAWLRTRPIKSGRRSLVCIPGTHTKWVEIVGDKVTRFQTSIAGELFDVVTANGVLATKVAQSEISSEAAFLGGVDASVRHPKSLMQLLMSVRARSLLAGQTPEEAADRLSGLLIGSDVANALALIGFQEGRDILPVIGTKNLADRYAIALRHVGITPLPLNAVNICVLGLYELAKSLRSQTW